MLIKDPAKRFGWDRICAPNAKVDKVKIIQDRFRKKWYKQIPPKGLARRRNSSVDCGDTCGSSGGTTPTGVDSRVIRE